MAFYHFQITKTQMSTQKMQRNINNAVFGYLLSMRHRTYFQYFEEFIENNQAYFCELLSLIVEKTEDPNSHYSKIPSDTQRFFRLSRLDFRMSIEQNKEGKFIYND